MAAQFLKTPCEVWEQIFARVPANSQLQCQYVCKVWYLPAKRVFLRHISLENRFQVNSFIHCISTFGDETSFSSVKMLKMGNRYNTSRSSIPLDISVLEKLMVLLPNIIMLQLEPNFFDLEIVSSERIIRAMKEHWPLLNYVKFDVGVLDSATKSCLVLE